jgi:hypothetical protein
MGGGGGGGGDLDDGAAHEDLPGKPAGAARSNILERKKGNVSRELSGLKSGINREVFPLRLCLQSGF